MNAYAERFVRSIKSECLSRMILLGENHLRVSIRAFVAHYHLERNHQGLVDLAKNVFEIAISREAGKVSKQLRVSRPKLVSFFAKQSAATRASRSLRLGSLLGKERSARSPVALRAPSDPADIILSINVLMP